MLLCVFYIVGTALQTGLLYYMVWYTCGYLQKALHGYHNLIDKLSETWTIYVCVYCTYTLHPTTYLLCQILFVKRVIYVCRISDAFKQNQAAWMWVSVSLCFCFFIQDTPRSDDPIKIVLTMWRSIRCTGFPRPVKISIYYFLRMCHL